MHNARGPVDPASRIGSGQEGPDTFGASPLIACVGVAFQDMIFGLTTLPRGQGKSQARSLHVSGGGMAANAAVAITKLGGRARFFGRVGDDAVGQTIVADLASAGVDTTGVRVCAGAASPTSAILVDAQGERQVVAYPGETLAREASWLEPSHFARANVVLADVRWVQGAARALALARALHLPGVLDADAAPAADLAELVPLADHVVFSEPGLSAFAPGLSQAQALRQALRAGAEVAVVTLGERGLVYVTSDDATPRSIPAYPVQAVETLGAGDVFHGAYALGVAQGLGLLASLELASAAAACKCRKAGGRAGIPARDEVIALRSAFGR